MPQKRTKLTLFEYQCPKCLLVFEDLANNEDEPQVCPKCGVQAPRVVRLHPHPKHASWPVK